MELKPLPTPRRGVLAFNGTLLVRFRSRTRFRVYNGQWDGSYDGEFVTVDDIGSVLPSKPFEEVVSITPEERQLWYLGDHPIIPEPRTSLKDEIPY